MHAVKLGVKGPQLLSHYSHQLAGSFQSEYLQSILLDGTTGHLYYSSDERSTLGSPNRSSVSKLAYGKVGDDPFFRPVNKLVFSAGEAYAVGGVLDPNGKYGYWGVSNIEGINAKIIKVALGEGDEPLRRVGTLRLDSSEIELSCAIVDPDSGFAYFGGSSGALVQIKLEEGDTSPTKLRSLQLPDQEKEIWRAVLDPVEHCAYFATAPYEGRIVKVALGDGSTTPVLVGSVALEAGEESAGTLLIDVERGQLIVGTSSSPPKVIRYALGAQNELPARLSELTLGPAIQMLGGGAFDPATRKGLVSNMTTPGQLVSLPLDPEDFPTSASMQFAAIPGKVAPRGIVLDPEHRYAYVGSDDTTTQTLAKRTRITKVAVPEDGSALRVVGTVDAGVPGLNVRIGALDPVRGYLYFSGAIGPYGFVGGTQSLNKYALGEGDALPQRVATLNLLPSFDHNGPFAIGIDSKRGYAYLTGVDKFFSLVVKVALGEGDAAPVAVSELRVPAGSHLALIDSEGGYGYFYGEQDSTFFKLRLEEGDTTPTLMGSVGLGGEGLIEAGALDVVRGFAYLTTASPSRTTAHIYEVGLGEGADPPYLSQIFDSPVSQLHTNGPLYDAVHGLIYLPLGESPTAILRVDPRANQNDVLKGVKITLDEIALIESLHFYSHAAEGSVRLSLYDDHSPRRLLWESGPAPNTAAGAWIDVPIAQGEPNSLLLSAGGYWLAWQCDTRASVPSYTAGAEGDGFAFNHAFGPAPLQLADGPEVKLTNEKWSIYATFGLPKFERIRLYLLGGAESQLVQLDVNHDESVDIADFLIAYLNGQ